MSKGPENTFIQSIHKLLPKKQGLYWMKNHNEYNGGIADCWYSAKLDLWVEFKFIKVPARDATVIDLVTPKGKSQVSELSALQQEWLKGRHAEGRKVAVIVGCKDGGVWLPGTTWAEPFTTANFKDNLMSRKDLANLILETVEYVP